MISWPDKILCARFAEENEKHDQLHCPYCMRNIAIDDCAAAYVANIPTVEEIERAIDENSLFEGEARKHLAQAIHDLFSGKVK